MNEPPLETLVTMGLTILNELDVDSKRLAQTLRETVPKQHKPVNPGHFNTARNSLKYTISTLSESKQRLAALLKLFTDYKPS